MARHHENTFRVPAPTDGAVLRIGSALLKVLPKGRVTLVFGPDVSEELDSDGVERRMAEYPDPSGRRIGKMLMTIPGHGGSVVYFDRSVTTMGQQGPHQVASAYEAEFVFEHLHNAGTKRQEVLNAVWDNLGIPFPAPGTVPPQLLDVFSRQAQTLSEQTLANNADLTAARRRLEAEVLEQKAALQSEFEKARSEFEVEVSERRQALVEQETRLQAKMKDVDDRRARHARREHRQNITAQVKQRLASPAASAEVRRHRMNVFTMGVLGFTVAVASATFAGIELSQDSTTAVSLKLGIDAARFFASSLLATVLLFYLLGYWRRVERDDAQYARDMERFSLDIDRASWVVETVMEFRDEKIPGEVPEAWLNGATANLFNAKQDMKDEEPNALEALAELLKKGARVQVGPNGAEVEVSGKTAEKVGKSAG